MTQHYANEPQSDKRSPFHADMSHRLAPEQDRENGAGSAASDREAGKPEPAPEPAKPLSEENKDHKGDAGS